MANAAQVGVWSEIGKLRRVLVCPPGLAHDRLTPDTAEDLLYDDVLWVQQARRDHFDFVAKMEDRGVEVLELDELLEDVVADSAARGWLLDRKITPEQVGAGIAKEVRPWLDEMAAKELAQLLIGGIPFHEVPREVAGPFTAAFGETSHTGFVIKPLPNTQFMRDNSLSNRVFTSHDNIIDHCCEASNKLIDQPWRIMTIGRRKWARRS